MYLISFHKHDNAIHEFIDDSKKILKMKRDRQLRYGDICRFYSKYLDSYTPTGRQDKTVLHILNCKTST